MYTSCLPVPWRNQTDSSAAGGQGSPPGSTGTSEDVCTDGILQGAARRRPSWRASQARKTHQTQNQPRQTQNQQVPGNSPGDNEPMKAELGSETLFISSNTDRNKLQQIVRNIKTSWTPVTSQWYHRGRSQTFWMSAGTNIYVCRNFK